MNTKTMRLPPRRVVTSTNKRKEREGFDSLKSLTPQQPHQRHPPQPPPLPRLSKPSPTQASGWDKPTKPSVVQPNQLLAGYLAHEFLTRGTLFGQQRDPARAEATPSPSGISEPKRAKPSQRAEPNRKAEEEDDDDTNANYQRYVEVAGLLKADGAHLPGIVNPTQLARFLQM